MLARYQLPRGASMAWAIVARRAFSPSTPRAQGAPLRASGVDRSARPSKWLSCQQCEEAPLGLPRSIFNRHPPEVSITEICYQFRVSHMGCSLVAPKYSASTFIDEHFRQGDLAVGDSGFCRAGKPFARRFRVCRNAATL